MCAATRPGKWRREGWYPRPMRFAILGNCGSGKSTLASALAGHYGATALDLDTIAWVPGTVGIQRESAEAAAGEILERA